MKSRRILLAAAAVAIGALGLSACSAPAADDGEATIADKLVVGDVGGWLESHLEAAELLDDVPYEIEFKDVGGANAYTTLASGQIDAGVWGFDANGAKTIVNGSGARIVGLIGRDGDDEASREQGNINLFVSEQSGIEDLDDLRGKTIGVNWGQGTTADVVLQAALAEAGLAPADLDVKYFTDATGNTAFLSRQLDGFVTSVNGALVEDMENEGTEVLYYANEASAVSYVIASTEKIMDDPAKSLAVADFVERVTAYYDWRHLDENHEAFAEAVGVQQSIDAELGGKVADAIATTVSVQPYTDEAIADYQEDLDNLVTWGLLDEAIDVQDLIDTRYAENIDAARD
ncbi:ABC transporter substrate-binding protein [Leucobacter allii]|uniref:ABC transporter substrate-binding protein n=1 Tax=Leucobacter allii TaxID=2932247 RepID=A0ABY4FL24_9MICO|nr:ABC transporter substrate-binding protein [Leucobacter allii]UOQ56972.1 ABC transporter substrate-binding protein [Leucobacter allii]